MTSKCLGQPQKWFKQIPSTNDYAKAHASELAHGTVVGADIQTAGRGTHGRTWSSDSAHDLYFSIVLREQISLEQLPLLALRTALAVVRTLDDIGLGAQIKWPNDVLVDGKKISGILIESSVQGEALVYVVVGVGLNVGRTQFDGDFEVRPTSVALETAQEHDREELLSAFLRHFESSLTVPRGTVVAQAEANLAWRDDLVSVDGLEGVLLGLDPSGALRLQTETGERALTVGRLKRV